MSRTTTKYTCEYLKYLKKRLNTFVETRNWKKFHTPKNAAINLILEASEVLELFQFTLDNDINPRRKNQLADELADVLYWLLRLADMYNIDLLQAFDTKMDENEKKYPVEKFKGTNLKYNEK